MAGNSSSFSKFDNILPQGNLLLQFWGLFTGDTNNIVAKNFGADGRFPKTNPSTFTWKEDAVVFFNPAVARFRVPVAGDYKLTAAFTALNNTATTARILIDGTVEFERALGDIVVPVAATFTTANFTMSEGEFIDFEIDIGLSEGTLYTQVDATVQLVL
jgi:hypothetical protein